MKTLISLVAATLIFCACDSLKDSVNETAAQTEDFDQALEDMPVAGTGGLCTPVMTFSALLGELDWWADAQDHLDSVDINTLDYRIPKNESPVELQIDLYLSGQTDPDAVTQSEYIGSTDLLLPKWKVTEWKPLLMTDDGPDRLGELIMQPDTPFTICAKVPQVDSGEVTVDQVNLKLELRIAGTATFVPIGN
jgi:hypothetical protein